MNKVELGLGIHGEAGVRTLDRESCSEIAKKMIEHLSDPSSSTHLSLNENVRTNLHDVVIWFHFEKSTITYFLGYI